MHRRRSSFFCSFIPAAKTCMMMSAQCHTMPEQQSLYFMIYRGVDDLRKNGTEIKRSKDSGCGAEMI